MQIFGHDSTFWSSCSPIVHDFNQVVDIIDHQWGRLLSDFNHPLLSPGVLELYAEAIYRKGSALNNVWGFIDGTTRACARPRRDQRLIYNGHKRYHCLKYQSITTPNGIIANLFGPMEGRRHDSFMLARSGVMPLLEQHSFDSQGNSLCIYGDAGYPLRRYLQTPFLGNLTQQQKDFNEAMSKVRVSVEWLFGDILKQFKFTDFRKNQKLGLSPIGTQYRVSVLLTNAFTCLYGNNTSHYFDCEPPIIEEYFV